MSESLTRANIRALVAVSLLLSLPAFLSTGVGAAVTSLALRVDPSDPYLPWIEPGLLYFRMPLAVLGSLVLVMSPGLFAALAMGRGRNIWSWLLEGFVISFTSISVVAVAVQAIIGKPLVGAPFVLLVLSMSVAAALALYLRVRRGRPTCWPLGTRRSRLILTSLVTVPLLFVVALTPKFFWESFNGDGAHAYLTARLLLFNPMPFFPPEAGPIAQWPGVIGLTFPYVPSWFMRLFGPNEAGIRLPLLLFMPLLVAAVAALAEAGDNVKLNRQAIALIWASVISFALVMSFSASYDPYAADIALPANHDFPLMIFSFGALLAFAKRDTTWLLVWTLLALLTSPGSLPILGLLLVAWFVSVRPLPWRSAITCGLGLVACLLLLAILPVALGALGVKLAVAEHSPVALFFSKYDHLAVLDFERFVWVAVPCGVYPIVGLFGWRRWDAITRALILATFALFAMYYVVAVLSLHYFVPAMVLPLVIFWRKYGGRTMRRLALAGCWVGAVLALWLALPASTGIYVASRTIGATIDVHAIEGFDRADATALRMSTLLGQLFSIGTRPEVPDETYGGSPLSWMYYASDPRSVDTPKNYVLAPLDAPSPAGATRIAEDHGAAVYVYDMERWNADRAFQPRSSLGKKLYRVPRSVLFLRTEDSRRPGFINARSIVARLLGRGNGDTPEGP